jgi:hypothetical protein
VKYKAKITGHEPPFKWSVWGQKVEGGPWVQAQVRGMKETNVNGGTSFSESLMNAEGQSPSFEEAAMAAADASQLAEYERKHSETVREVELGTYEVDIPTEA